MYASSFGLTEAPFSISPDPRYLYMSERHQEAMAHLRYGIQESGGFVQLTGEVGTGKTTICRCMLEQLPDNVDVALILNPQISHNELLATLCDEIGVAYPDEASPKQLLDLLNERLIETFSQGRRTVLVIDEAQMLTREVLEQIRILTNLETTKQKLLQIILIGQPELSVNLSRRDLRQLAQRITARYHLEPLKKDETAAYIRYRLGVAGCHRSVFTRGALRRVYKLSGGVPRLINMICDRAMLGAYSSDSDKVNAATVSQAAREVFDGERPGRRTGVRWWMWMAGLAVASVLAVAVIQPGWVRLDFPGLQPVQAPASTETEPQSSATERTPSDAVASVTASADSEPGMTFPDLLNSGHAARSEAETLDRLLEAWHLSFNRSGGLSCPVIEELYGLRCLKERGTWADLQGFNRVAALVLQNGGEISYLLLTGLNGRNATVAGRNEVYDFSRSDIDPYWDGDYLLLWRAPPHGARTIAEHAEGVDVLWLRHTLNRVPSIESLELDNTYFDSSLKERIMAFQRSNNLHVDGVAGVHTIIRLNNIVDPDVPKLDSAAG